MYQCQSIYKIMTLRNSKEICTLFFFQQRCDQPRAEVKQLHGKTDRFICDCVSSKKTRQIRHMMVGNCCSSAKHFFQQLLLICMCHGLSSRRPIILPLGEGAGKQSCLTHNFLQCRTECDDAAVNRQDFCTQTTCDTCENFGRKH